MKIIGLSGSFRKLSYNKSALNFINDELLKMEILDLTQLPFFNEDLEENIPDIVIEYKNKIKDCDGIIIATPEYNHSVPAVLKNAIDWFSRGEKNILNSKPTAIISASISFLGGARSQEHLKTICASLNMDVIFFPEVFITEAHTKFEDGKLIDERTGRHLKTIVDKLNNKINQKNSSN